MNSGFQSQLEALIEARLGRVVETLRDIAKDRMDQPYPPAAQPYNYPHKRTGGLQEAVFAEPIGDMEWAFGVHVVKPDPDRPDNNRERLGLWRELGTGGHRRMTDMSVKGTVRLQKRPAEIVRTSTLPNPFLIPTLMHDGPRVANFYMKD